MSCFYHEEQAEKAELLAAAKDFITVKKTFTARFAKLRALEENFLGSLDFADFRSLLFAMDSGVRKAGFDVTANHDLLRKAVMDYLELSVRKKMNRKEGEGQAQRVQRSG